MSVRDELAELLWDLALRHLGVATSSSKHMADELIAAGYMKADHIEYAADHKLSDMEFTDEDGELWTDRDDFEDYFKDYGGVKLVQRHVTEWESVR